MKLLSLFLLALSLCAHASDPPVVSSRSLALGSCSQLQSDPFAIVQSVARLAFQSRASIALHTYNYYGLSEYSSVLAAANYGYANSGIGLAVGVRPYANSREEQYWLGFAQKISEKLSAGVSMRYLQMKSTEYYGINRYFSYQTGLFYNHSDQLKLGLQINNINRSAGIRNKNEIIPQSIRLAGAYFLNDQLIYYGDAFLESNQQLCFDHGLEVLGDRFSFRMGYSQQRSALSFGTACRLKNISMDLTLAYHRVLGASPSFGITYAVD